MKKTVLLLCFSAFLSATFAQTKDPVIMSIGGQDVSKSEFEYIWNKNNTNNTTDKKSLDEYVDLFVNFKLKVAEAKSQGIDTTKSFITELSGYRRQLVAPYMMDKEAETAMYKEAYDRLKEYVETSHILVMVQQNASPADTLKAYLKAQGIYFRIKNGNDFAKLAQELSDDGSKKDGGYLGYSTGLQYIYPFENVLFNTPVGTVSKPFRTQFGYHIIKVHNRRPAMGLYRAGHILKIVSPNATPEMQAAAKDSIFKIYESLKNGGDFTLYATKHSDDQNAASKNGEYALMYSGKLPYEFENALYQLKVGEYSAPFQTKYGWHIVKALEFQPYPEMEKAREYLSKTITRGDRTQAMSESMVEKLKKEYNYTLNEKNLDPFFKAVETINKSNDSTLLKALNDSENTLFTLNGVVHSQKEFAASLADKNIKQLPMKETYNTFVQGVVMAYEDSQLEKKYPEFGHLMQEYKDGILLFEVSNREVWEKASLDTTGLENYFETNKAKYAWDKPRYKGFIIQCANADVAKKAKKLIKKMPADSIQVTLKRTFNTDSTTLIKVERGLFAKGENPTIDALAYKTGKLEAKAEFPNVFLQGSSLPKGPEVYTDVRGLVISDYQGYLEERWIQSLKDKFKVIVYKDVVNTVNKN